MNQLEMLEAIVKTLQQLADNITVYVKSMTDPNTPYAEIYDPAKDAPFEAPLAEPPKEESAVTLTDVRAVLAEKSRSGFKDDVKLLLQKYGAEKLSGLAESEFAAVMKEAQSLGS